MAREQQRRWEAAVRAEAGEATAKGAVETVEAGEATATGAGARAGATR